MARAMIVCCYGNFDERSRSRIEMNGYKEYLKGVARLIISHRPDYVVLCGGLTRPELEVSEAASVRPALEQYLEERKGSTELPVPEFSLLLEERSLNTPQNLQFSLDQLVERGEDLDRVIVVCDHVRRFKAWVLMWRLTSVPYEVVGLPRQDIHPNSTWKRQILQALLYLVLPKKRIFS